MTIWTSALLMSLVLILLFAALISWTRLQRLHRLHRRSAAARRGLELALERRADAAAAVAGSQPEPTATALREAVTGCRGSGSPGIAGAEREGPENALGRLLAGLDRTRVPEPARTELGDAEQSLVVARSVHNDAVRDTLVLRSRRLVRWLRLAGTAPLPSYFEIADAAPDLRPSAPRLPRGAAGTPSR